MLRFRNPENKEWSALSYEEKNHQLFLRQKALLDGFLEHGAITQAQHDKPVREEVDEYIVFFNELRPAYALNYLTPKQYRESFSPTLGV